MMRIDTLKGWFPCFKVDIRAKYLLRCNIARSISSSSSSSELVIAYPVVPDSNETMLLI